MSDLRVAHAPRTSRDISCILVGGEFLFSSFDVVNLMIFYNLASLTYPLTMMTIAEAKEI